MIPLLLLSACSYISPVPPLPTATDQKNISSNGTIRVASTLGTPENGGLIYQVKPVYPKEAKKARIQGTVKFDAVISKTGEVIELRLISGDPMLVPAASKAVRQWRYSPTRINGEAVEVKTQIDINFTLNQ